LNLNSKSVLEIGAHAGAFLVHLNKEYDCDTYFNEMSEEANKVLASKDGLTDYGITNAKKMDLIVLRHVLEHIFDLDYFIKYLKNILTESGYLFIEVPDWSWLDNQTDPLVFEHLNQFSTHNLIFLMKRLGWQCEAVEKSVEADDPATPNRVQRLLFKPNKVPDLFDDRVVDYFKEFYQDTYGGSNVAINTLLSKINENKKIALYPASHLTFTALNESKLTEANIVGIFDIDPKKHGKVIGNIEIFPADNLISVSPDLILLFTMGYEREIRNSFAEMGIDAEVISISQLIEQKY
jgi:SAM-dependent methyltransferase